MSFSSHCDCIARITQPWPSFSVENTLKQLACDVTTAHWSAVCFKFTVPKKKNPKSWQMRQNYKKVASLTRCIAVYAECGWNWAEHVRLKSSIRGGWKETTSQLKQSKHAPGSQCNSLLLLCCARCMKQSKLHKDMIKCAQYSCTSAHQWKHAGKS